MNTETSILRKIRHRTIHNREGPFKCDICDKEFATLDYLRAHRKTHWGAEKYKCDMCGKGFTLKSHLITHLQLKFLNHTGEKNFICTICYKSFALQSYLERHMFRHKINRWYKCEVCEKPYFSKSTFNKHMAIHIENESHTCKECKCLFPNRSEWKKHITTCYRKLKCRFCNKTFRYIAWLSLHEKHHKEKPYECEICQEVFIQKNDLSEHRKTHKGESFECNECGKKFIQKCNLATHVLLAHERKVFDCKVCGKIFKWKGYLDRHMISHTDQAPYVCNYCGRSDFVSGGGFIRHKKACTELHKSTVDNSTIEEESIDNPSDTYDIKEINSLEERSSQVINDQTPNCIKSEILDIEEEFFPQVEICEIDLDYHFKLKEHDIKSEKLDIDERFFPEMEINEINLEYQSNSRGLDFNIKVVEDEQKFIPPMEISDPNELYPSISSFFENKTLDIKEEFIPPSEIISSYFDSESFEIKKEVLPSNESKDLNTSNESKDSNTHYDPKQSNSHLCVQCWKSFSYEYDYIFHKVFCKENLKPYEINYVTPQPSINYSRSCLNSFDGPYLCVQFWKYFKIKKDYIYHKSICQDNRSVVQSQSPDFNSHHLELIKSDETIKEEIKEEEDEECLKNQLMQLNL